MKQSLPILSVILLMASGGCVPNAVTYYRPSVEGGQLRTPHGLPTQSLVDFALGSRNQLPVRALANDGKYVHQIALLFSWGPWEQCRFLSANFRVYDCTKRETLLPSSVLAHTGYGGGPLTTEPFLPRKQRNVVQFSVQVNIAGALPEDFILTCPHMVIDGEEIEIPPLRFVRKRWVGISPFNF